MKINGKDYNLKFTGLTLVIYKEEFHKDFLSIITGLDKAIADNTTLFEITWALIKTCDDSIPSFREWCNEVTDVTEIISKEGLTEIIKAINHDADATVEIKKN